MDFDAQLQAAYDAEHAGSKAPVQPVELSPVTVLGDNVQQTYDDSTSQVPAEPFNLIGEVNKPFQPIWDYAAANWNMGREQVASNITWNRALRGEISDDEAFSNASDERMAELKRMKLDPIDSTVDPVYLRKIFGETIKALPFMAEVTAGAVRTAAITGTAGAGAGLLGGPFEPVTVPAGFAAGVGFGMKGGTFASAAHLSAGEMYGTLRKNGIPRDQAVPASIAFGLFAGSLQTLNLGILSKAAGRAYSKHFSDAVAKKLTTNAFLQFVVDAGLQVTAAEAQQIASMATEINLARINNRPTLSNDEIAKRLVESFTNPLAAAVGLQVLAKGAGHTAAFSKARVTDMLGRINEIASQPLVKKKDSKTTRTVNRSERPTSLKQLKGRIEKTEPQTLAEAERNYEQIEQQRKDLREDIVALQEHIDHNNIEPPSAAHDELTNLKQEMAFVRGLKQGAYRQLLQARIEERLQKDELFDPQEANNLIEAAIETRFSANKTVEQNQKALTQFIQKSLPQKLHGKLQGFINSATSVSKLDDAWQMVRDQIKRLNDGEAMVKARAELNKQLDQIETRMRGAKTDSKYEFEANVILNEYKRLIEDAMLPEKKTQRLAENLIYKFDTDEARNAANQDSGVTTPYLNLDEQYFIAADVVGFKNKDSEAVLDLAHILKTVIEDGKTERMLKREQEKQGNLAVRDLARKEAEGNKPVQKITKLKSGEVMIEETQVSAIDKWLRTHGETYAPWNILMENVFQFSKNNKEVMEALDVHTEVQTELTNIREQTEKAWKHLTSGDKRFKKQVEKIWAESYKPENFQGKDTFVDQEGFIRRLDGYSKDDAIKLYAMMKNPRRRTGLAQGNKFTFEIALEGERELKVGERSTQAMLEELLTADEKEIARRVSELYDGEMFDRMNEAVIDEYALPLDKHRHYEGHARRESSGVEEGSHLDQFQAIQDRRRFLPASILDTVEAKRAYVIKGSGSIHSLLTAIKTNEHWLAWRKKSKTLQVVFSDPVLKKIIDHHHSKDTFRIVEHAYMSMVGTRGVQHVMQNRILAFQRGQVATAYTAGKLVNAMAQIAGLFNNIAEIGPHRLAAGVIDFMLQPEHAIKTLSETDFVKNRADNLIAEVSELSQTQGNAALKLGKATTGLMMKGITVMDRVTIMMGGWSVYRAKYMDVLKETGNSDTAHRLAVNAFERSQNRLQGSATVDQITHQERGGDWQKAAMLFFKQPVQVYQSQLVAMRRYANNPSLNNAAKVASAIVAAHLAEAIFETIRQTPNFFDDEKTDDALVAVASRTLVGPTLPIWGDLSNMILVSSLNAALGTRAKAFEPKFMPLDSVIATGKLGALAVKVASEGDISVEDFFNALENFAKGPGIFVPGLGGLPLLPFIKFAKSQAVEK